MNDSLHEEYHAYTLIISIFNLGRVSRPLAEAVEYYGVGWVNADGIGITLSITGKMLTVGFDS